MKSVLLIMFILFLTNCEIAQVRGEVNECVRYRKDDSVYRVIKRKDDIIYVNKIYPEQSKVQVEFRLIDSLDGTWTTVDCP